MKFEVVKGCFAYSVHKSAPANILCNVTYEVKSGQILAVLGPNGAGKTTLLRCSMGLLQWRGGGSFIDGINIKDLPPRRLWQRIAYVPQARSVSQQFTAEEMVLIGRSSYLGPWEQPKSKDREIALTVMERVGITHLIGKNCAQMSGGEFQMVLIARALAGEPELLVLDEPESNLDFKNQLIMLETLRKLADEQGICCIFNTHYPVNALKYADRALILESGGGFLTGTSHEVITENNLEHTFGVKVYVRDIIIDGCKYSEVLPVALEAGRDKI